ncbi:hypothetical protein [Macrococcoides caseolyticum]|uniref:hypothetical protein n=1 Tax=Macrococcoides caseolyticum TaxID=69966 RepID=UPI000C31BFCA|nr:hypothetical protein [Macrococcus caseolyticus]PKD99336.1 hypothetical protein CW719_04665 [Macrococcus caseolyticus]PKE16262.1 hypothetical protein CW718_10400 [Macrococcus caseolyticus]PKE36464.1 hypothetical protein CW695_03695 [Macrococcus caseolyticus]PKE43978.1 hypothetical protein CW666_06535 [Macrococcus caseolyticus]PKE67047.1 hypothetical protein CW663_09845 [Macrococcus caseolyticus]
MRTRADVLAELNEQRQIKPNSYASNLHKVYKIRELEQELGKIEAETNNVVFTQTEQVEQKKLKFIVDGFKITIEHI